MLPDEILEGYQEKQKLYADFALAIKNLLQQLLTDKGIKYELISHREKDQKKLKEKIDRKKETGTIYTDLESIEDLAGVRIVFYLESEQKEFLEILRSEFGEFIKDGEEKYVEGGYRATHLILQLDKKRAKLTEYSRFKGLKCELQVTSSLYHAWSEVEHDIGYKQTDVEKKQLKQLEDLGLKEIRLSFKKVMKEHIQTASRELDYLKKTYQALAKAGGVFSSNFIEDIQKAKSNDDIYETLKIVEGYFGQKPEEIMAIIKAVLSKKPLPEKVIYVFKDDKLYGKSHADLVKKCLELIDHGKYVKSEEILDLLKDFMQGDDRGIKNQASDILKRFTEYNFQVLTKVGYVAQRMALDYVLQFSEEEKIKNFDFVAVVLGEIVSADVKGFSQTTFDTFTFHSGTVDPTDFLRKMRREALDATVDLFRNIENIEAKLKLLGIMEEASRAPMHANPSDKVTEMIKEDNEYLMDIYRSIAFEKKGKTISNLGIVEKIETRLYWLNHNKIFVGPKIEKLRNDILKNRSYHIFRLLVGDAITYQEEAGWEQGDKQRKKDIEKLAKKVDKRSIKKWISILDSIAAQNQSVQDWQFGEFRGFLRRITQEKPGIADIILKDAFKKGSAIKHFLNEFLDGFRNIPQFDLWDKYVAMILKEKSSEGTFALILSLNLPQGADLSKLIRKSDLTLLDKIVKQLPPFDFLKGLEDRRLHNALINTLSRIYPREPKVVENLIVQEMKKNPNYTIMYLGDLEFSLRRKTLDLTKWSKKNLNALAEKLIEVSHLGWDSEGLLIEIAKINPALLFRIIMERIKTDRRRKNSLKLSITDRFEPIPHEFRPEFRQYVSNLPEYTQEMAKWVANMTWNWSVYNWDVSHFIQRVGGLGEVLMTLVRKGGDQNLMKAARALHSMDHPDFATCLEIVKRTSNKKIISQIEANLYTTGVVTGEYGIAEAYEQKAKALEPYVNDPNIRLKAFAKRIIMSFKKSAIAERKRSDEGQAKRRLDFEGV